ncbi:two-component sensor histidine kinase, partial [Actinoplanes sp. NPDC048791]
MRWQLNRLALAITSMVALAFLVPLIFATRQIAHDRAIGDARQQAAAMVAALAVNADPKLLTSAVASTVAGSAGRLAVHLPGIAPVGTTHVTGTDVASATSYRRPVTAPAAGGLAYLQPSVLSDGRAVVIEVYVPEAEMRRGVWPAWFALGGLAIALVAGSTLVADRLGSRLVRATRDLAGSSRRLG